MNKYKGTQTEKNLQAAFSGESGARNKYTYFASVAKKEGYEQISAIFLKTAENEKEHAKLWLKELNGIGDTTTNLIEAAAGENFEWTSMKNLQQLLKKKALLSLQQNSVLLQQLKNITKKDIVHCLKILKQTLFSKRQKTKFGNAETADTELMEKLLLKYALLATTHKAILK